MVRLSKNTSELVDIGTRADIIDTFYERLQLSGYSHEQSVRIITSGLTGYERIRRNAARVGGNINRSAAEGVGERHKKKLLGKTNWFKMHKKREMETEKRGNRNTNNHKNLEATPPVVSVLFVPKTGGSVLQKRLQELEPGLSAISGERVRYVERTGVTMKQLLHRNNPWAGAPCYKADSCLSCASDKDIKDNCSKRSILYEVHCGPCRHQAELDKAAGKDWVDYLYVGQTSESCFVRGNSHQTDMKAGMKGQCDTSHMASHIIMTHGGVASEAKFIMKKIKSYPSTFLRILAEAIRIKNRAREKGIVVLNQKSGDFGSYTLPRLSVQSRGQEGEPPAPAQSASQTGDERREARRLDTQTRVKGKVKFKQKI